MADERDSASPDETAATVSELSSNRPKTARFTALAVGAVVFGLIGVLALANPGGDKGGSTSLLLGRVAPRTVGPTLDGGSFDLDDHRGSWVAVNFFATWCPGCVNEHDDLVALERWGRTEGDLQLVSVVFQDPPDQVVEFFAERGGSWPVLDNPSVPIDFGVAQIPETFLVAPSGQVVHHFQGEVTADQVVALIAELS